MASIRTERLVLRPLELSDAPRISAFTGDLDVARMTAVIPYPQFNVSVEGFLLMEQARRPLGVDHMFAIELPGETLIGVSSAHARGSGYQGRHVVLGYWIGKPYWGRGYATEAARAVADYAVGLDRGPVLASHYADNPASGRVLEKAGFVYTGKVEPHFSLARGEHVPSRVMERKALRRAA